MDQNKNRLKTLLCVLMLSICSSTFAEKYLGGRLEAGVGISSIHIPDYIGSSKARNFIIPFPYIRYTGEKVKIDRNLIRTEFYSNGNLHANISFGGSIPARSEGNPAREGMEDLDFLIEAGPAVQYYFSGDQTAENAFYLDVPLRAAIASDFTFFQFEGLTLNPSLTWRRGYDYKEFFVRPQISFLVRSANDMYHDYIYGVDNRFVTADRPQYDGKMGYGGWQFGYSTSVRWDKQLVAGFIRYLRLENAIFEDSPLVEESDSLFAGVAVAWLF